MNCNNLHIKHSITRICAIIILMFAAVFPATAQRYKSISFSRHNFVDTVKIEIWNGAVIIPVEIEGKVRNLMFDSGAQTGFWVGSIEEWMQDIDSIRVRDSNNESHKTTRAKFPPMTMGSVVIENYSMVVNEGLGDFVCGKIDGALGFDLVAKGLSFKFDTKDSLMIVTDRKGFFAKEERKQPALKYDGLTLPRVWVDFPFSRVRMLFDMGYVGGWFNLPQTLLNRWSSTDPKMRQKLDESTVQVDTSISTQAGLFGAKKDSVVDKLLYFPEFKMGELTFKEVWCETGVHNLAVGSAMLQHLSLIIDARKRCLVFLPHNEIPEVIVGNEVSGLSFILADEDDPHGVMKALVRKDSKGYQKGIRTGDYLISIDGIPITDYCTYFFLRQQKEEQHYLLFRSPEGEEKTVEW